MLEPANSIVAVAAEQPANLTRVVVMVHVKPTITDVVLWIFAYSAASALIIKHLLVLLGLKAISPPKRAAPVVKSPTLLLFWILAGLTYVCLEAFFASGMHTRFSTRVPVELVKCLGLFALGADFVLNLHDLSLI